MKNPIYKSLLLLLIPGILFSKSIEGTSMAKLSHDLQNLIKEKSSKNLQLVDTPFSRVRTAKGPSGEILYPVTIRSTDIEAVKAAGIQTNSDYPGFSTARVTAEQLEILSELDAVNSVFQGDVLYPLNDLAVSLSGADLLQDGYLGGTAYDGTDVIVLVIDTGIDWTHLDFCDPLDPTKTRILYIWDMTLTTGSSTPYDNHGEDFLGLNIGVEYDSTQINDELNGTTTGTVLTEDTNGHGTEVTGAAAGNGASALNGKYKGMAPKADIIVVRAGADSFEDNNVIDALTYAKEIAADLGKPVVVNLSLGGQTNAHDGTSTLDVAVNTFTSNGAAVGRVAVVAAGNAGNEDIHVTGDVGASLSGNITITVPSYGPNPGITNDAFQLELWWNNGDDVTINLVSPNSYSQALTAGQDIGGFTYIGTAGANDGIIDMNNIIGVGHSNGDRMTELTATDYTSSPLEEGTWTLQLTNNSGFTMTYHAWLHTSTMGATITGGDHNYTIASPGSASSAITVGAYASRWRWKAEDGYVTLGEPDVDEPDGTDDHAYFSSYGPTRAAGVQKPDIMTHGQGVITTTSTQATTQNAPGAAFKIVADKYHVEQGTSVAAGSVSGAAALLLEYSSSLTATQVKNYITNNANKDDYTGLTTNTEWGHGKLNIFKSLVEATGGSNLNHESFSYDTWDVDTAAYQGIGNTVKEAVKFTTVAAGDVTGAFFYPHKIVPSSDTISFEIWSDDSGIPGTKVGSTVKMPCADIAKFTWNYVSLTAAGVSVDASTNFHLVLDNTSGGDFTLVKAVTSISNRSSKNQGLGWVAITEHDFRIRAVVSNKAVITSPTLPLADNSLPVELAFFNASTVKGQMVLKWATESETENLGFMIERRKSGTDDWTFISDHTKDKGLEGQGSTSSRTDYIYYDKTAKPGVKYDYRLTDIPYTSAYTPTSIVLEDIEFRIAKFALHKNYPNPFNPATTISYELSDYSDVQVKIFDVNGREVQSWDHNGQEAGYHEMVWAGVNHSGRPVSAGLYLLSVQAGNNLQTRKLLLLK